MTFSSFLKKRKFSLDDFFMNYEEPNDSFSYYASNYQETVSIDPTKSIIYGWESGQSKELVYYFKGLIDSGVRLPSIQMILLARDEYCLLYENQFTIFGGMFDGGHHRVIAHQIARKNISAMLYDLPIPGFVNKIISPENMVSDIANYEFHLNKYKSVKARSNIGADELYHDLVL